MIGLIIICIIIGAVLFYAVSFSEKKRGRSYSIKEFILELIGHTGDSRNYRR